MSSNASSVYCEICEFPHYPNTIFRFVYPSNLRVAYYCQVPEFPEWTSPSYKETPAQVYMLSRKGSYILRIESQVRGWGEYRAIDLYLTAHLQHKRKPLGHILGTRGILLKSRVYMSFDEKDEALKDLQENALSYLTVAHL